MAYRDNSIILMVIRPKPVNWPDGSFSAKLFVPNHNPNHDIDNTREWIKRYDTKRLVVSSVFGRNTTPSVIP